jgi:hypothetical protein
MEKTSEGDVDPFGVVEQLIVDLEDAAGQNVKADQELEFFAGPRQEGGINGGLEVGLQEGYRDPAVPDAGPGFQGGDVLRTQPPLF